MRSLKIWFLVVVIAALTVIRPAQAQTSLSAVFVEQSNSQTDRVSPHLRLTLKQELMKALDLKLTATPIGPMPDLSYAELIWHQPFGKDSPIDYLDAGRQFPPFGLEWYNYRFDQVPALLYSSIYGPAAAIDTGLSVGGHYRKLSGQAGLFVGDRIYGNAPRWRGGPDAYLRLEYDLTSQLLCGTSQRVGLVLASGFHLQYRIQQYTLTAETIGSKGRWQQFLQEEYRLNRRLSVVGRYEWLTGNDRVGLGFTYTPSKYFELKGLYQTNPGQLLFQSSIHW